MAHKNYSMFSKKVENNEDVIEEIQEEPIKVVVDPSQNVEVEQNKITGLVDGCDKLNVRSEPNKESNVLCIIDKLTELNIDINNSTEDFYKITTASGIDGYCMKKFVVIKSEE